MKLVFFGSGEFGLPTLEALAAQHDVAMVVSQPDRPAGRHRSLTPTPITIRAVELGVPVNKPEKVNDPAIIQQVRGINAEAWVVIAFGQKLGKSLLDGVFAINLHASLLPKYRGAAPINWAMIQGEAETGVSVITLADRMDAGAILVQRSLPIDPMETAGELHDRLAKLGPGAVHGVLSDHQRGTLRPVAQDESQVTQAPKFTKADGTVRFDQPAAAVQRRIHGLNPWPGCTVLFDGQPLKLLRVSVIDDAETRREPGIHTDVGGIACDPGMVFPEEVQAPGGRPLSWSAFSMGRGIRPGARWSAL